MKNNILYMAAALIIAVLALIYYTAKPIAPTENTPATTTPSVSTTTKNPPNPPVGQIQEAGTPIAVTGSAVTTNETAASVNGKVTPRGLFTSYWFEYGLTESLGSRTTSQNIGSGYAPLTSPAYITGLSKNTKYYFALVAENQYGRVIGNQYTFVTNAGSLSPAGSIPTLKTISATGISANSALLTAEVTPNKAATNYWFEYGKTANFGQTSGVKTINDINSKEQVSLALSNLEPGTNYYFRVNAQNQWGTVNGMTLSFKTSGPVDTAKPTAETENVNDLKNTSVTLRGTVNANGVETTYWFEYSTDSLLGSVLLKSTPRVSAGGGKNDIRVDANVANLISKTNYFYRVVAQNSLGITYGDRSIFKTK